MNENHLRVLTISLYNIERSINNIRRALEGVRTTDPILSLLEHDIKEESKAQILQGTSAILDIIEEARDIYGLQPQTTSLKRYIDAELAGIWCIINDLRPNHLENYGSLTEEDRKKLDSIISTLLVICDRILLNKIPP